ncbi:MAG: tetratricopeptide repeat protein [Gammaproteobacteria bacterium]|nr:tetratricopeptide repeat protein [Gammaproteobacteria bacterium]
MSELKRRNVLRMAAVYVVAAWLVMQVSEVVMNLANLPSWMGPTILGLLAIGFPIALVFSWFYEITPEGVALDTDADSDESTTYFVGRRLDFIVIALLCAAVLLFAYDKWWGVEPPAQSVAVLPFVNMSGDPTQEHFSDGMAEELMHRLAQISELRVAARTSAFYFKNKNVPVSEIAAQLDVRSVLEGSIRKAGNTLRVTAQLINANDGYHIWSKTYERESDDIFAIQDEIASQVVDALKLTLLGDEQARLKRQPTANLAAYEAYLLGRQTMARRTSSSLQEAVRHFSEAIKQDPKYALAHVGLADTHILLWRYGALDSVEALASAEPAVRRALQLDNMLGEAYASLGKVRFVQQDYPGSEKAFNRAIELNPNYAPAFDGYGLLLRWAFARKEEGLELHQTALELDPLSTPINMAVVETYLELGRYEDAMARCRKIIEIDSDFPRSYTIMADLYWEVFARLDEGVRWLRKAMEIDPGNPDHARWLGMIYLDLGDLAAGEYWMNEAMRLAPTQSSSKWAAVYLASYTGTVEAVVAAANELLAVSPSDGLALVRLRDADYQAGRIEDALRRYRQVVPDFVDGEDPHVNATNWSWAIESANVLIEVGERERANKLLNKALPVVKSIPRLGYAGYGISDAEIHALLGDKEAALSALSEAVDAGWRISWRVKTEMNDNLASLHDDSRYLEIVEKIRSQMAEQLAQVRVWEANGELTANPGSVN